MSDVKEGGRAECHDGRFIPIVVCDGMNPKDLGHAALDVWPKDASA